jgi:hypothetical protein
MGEFLGAGLQERRVESGGFSGERHSYYCIEGLIVLLFFEKEERRQDQKI